MTSYNEIYLIREPVNDLFKNLKLEERIFVYYMFRASLPFNTIYRDQNHRHTNELIELFQFLYDNKAKLESGFANDVETYLVYLWVNHGPYFMKEHTNNKRTPAGLNMVHLTKDKLVSVLESLEYIHQYDHLLSTIFDNTEMTMVVDGSIELSGNNYYAKGFTKEHYDSFSSTVKNRINAYFELDENVIPIVRYYSANDKYSDELKVAIYWLNKALYHATLYSKTFDKHIVKSLELLIRYLETGDEETFKQHSIEWLKTKSNLDYTMGFIETYHDPMGVRGHAGGEVTIKTMNMEMINPILLDIEQRMPIPDIYKKNKTNSTVMNVSMNKILFSSGDYGPSIITAAYCLPNYDDIRSKVGSKQILYKLPKSVESTLNTDLVKQFRTTSRQEFVDRYDPDDQIFEDLWDVQVLLHESIGHGSGAFHKHIFQEGENLTIGGVEYNVGDTIDVTDENYSEFISVDSSSLEELRAEINALYMSIAEVDVLASNGVFKNWLNVLGKEELQKQCIIEMCRHIFRRLLVQGDGMTDISGAHARANFVITNYLLNGHGIEIEDEVKNIDGMDYHVLGIKVIDLNLALGSTVELLQIVQRIKSTGDTNGCKQLFDKYTKYPVTLDQAKQYREYMLTNKQKMIGNIKLSSRLYPNYMPVLNNEMIDDVVIGNDMDIFQQNMHYDKLALSYEF